ncbi:MAG: hypothetical protein WC682_01545 [Parcubacteria group bacterium]|jgi:hypothetical protein
MEKKYVVIIAVILVATLGVIIFVTQSRFGKKDIVTSELNANKIVKEAKLILPEKEECSYANGAEAVSLALERGDITICDCIKNDDKIKESCNNVVNEADIYKRATREKNIDICQEIESEDGQKNCKENVLAKIEYLNNK